MGVLFDKIDDFISCGSNNTLMANGSAMTVSAWIKPNSTGEGNDGRILARLSGGAGLIVGMNSVLNRFNFVSVWTVGNVSQNTNDNAATLGVWQHFCLTWDGSSSQFGVKFYVNGIETTTQAGSDAVIGPTDNSGQLTYIGNDAGNANTFDGVISEAAFWSSVLSGSEITQLAVSRVKRTPLQISPSTLVAYWPLDQSADGIIASTSSMFRDLTANGNNGTPGGNPLGNAEEVLSYA